MVFRFGGAQLTDAVDDLGELVAALVAAGACLQAAVRGTSGRRAWTLMGVSAFCWAAGEALWSWYDLVLGLQVPFPSWADVGFLASVPVALAAITLFPAVGSGLSLARGALDGVLIAGSVFFVSWVTVLGPLYRQHQGSPFAQAVGLAYPISDVAIATLVIILVTRAGSPHRASLFMVGAGMLAFALSDSSFTYFTTANSYGIGNALDTGWVAGYLLIALGARQAVTIRRPGRPRPIRSQLATVVGPYPAVAVAGAVFAGQMAAGHSPGVVGDTVAFAVVCALSARQVLLLLDNLSLTRQLETRIEQQTAELHHRAFHDGLTELGNRTLFTEHLIRAVRRQSRHGTALSVLFVDLDGFKQVNDLYGHEIGDHLLREVADRLTRCVRSTDTVARLGGDEFAVLLEDEPFSSDPDPTCTRPSWIGCAWKPICGKGWIATSSSSSISPSSNWAPGGSRGSRPWSGGPIPGAA